MPRRTLNAHALVLGEGGAWYGAKQSPGTAGGDGGRETLSRGAGGDTLRAGPWRLPDSPETLRSPEIPRSPGSRRPPDLLKTPRSPGNPRNSKIPWDHQIPWRSSNHPETPKSLVPGNPKRHPDLHPPPKSWLRSLVQGHAGQIWNLSY